jgi:hypothetical protein
VCKIIAAHAVLGLEMTDHWFDGAARRRCSRLICGVSRRFCEKSHLQLLVVMIAPRYHINKQSAIATGMFKSNGHQEHHHREFIANRSACPKAECTI